MDWGHSLRKYKKRVAFCGWFRWCWRTLQTHFPPFLASTDELRFCLQLCGRCCVSTQSPYFMDILSLSLLGDDVYCFAKCFRIWAYKRSYRNVNHSLLLQHPSCDGRRHVLTVHKLLCFAFRQFVFIREVPVLKRVLIFFLFQSTEKLFYCTCQTLNPRMFPS